MRVFLALVLCTQMYHVWSSCTFSTCPDDWICCEGPYGKEGCCPLPDAVCCSDGLHCCPEGYQCDLKKGKCEEKNRKYLPFIYNKKETSPITVLKSAVMQEAQRVDVVYCPGGTSYCPDGSTCCLLQSGIYGCCPYPSAMCCSDRIHCCPHGSVCDVTFQYCLRSDYKIPVAPMKQRFPAFPVLQA